MLAEDRYKRIVDMVNLSGAARTVELADKLGVSEATVRRDLELLSDRGLLKRTHGGAIVVGESTAFEPLYAAKARQQTEAKARIGRAAAGLIADGQTVILDSGTTALAVARACHDKRVSVLALDLKVADELADAAGVAVHVVGGQLRQGFYSLVGPHAEQVLRQFHVNTFFLGADAVSTKGGVTNATTEEVNIKRLAIAAARTVVLVADATKFGHDAMFTVCPLDRMDRVITDRDLALSEQEELAEAGVAFDIV